MKKKYLIASLAFTYLFSACDSIDDKYYPELNTNTNTVTISYDVVSGDYTTIANIIKKPLTDSIAAKKIELSKATTKADSTAINAAIAGMNSRLTTMPVYANATKLDQNKYFDDVLKAKDYLPYLLSQKYPYIDENSSIKLAFDYVNTSDTTSVLPDNKFTLTDADYIQMGSASGQPGKTKCFTSAMNIMSYLNIYLKTKSPYAAANDVRMVRYRFNTMTTIQYRVLTFDGTNWKNTAAQYAFKKGKWQDVVILKGLTDGIGDFKAISVTGDQVWAWNSYKYMLMTGYVSGTYYDNEDWLITPAMNFAERVNPVLNFTHVGRYFNAGTPNPEAMKKAITIWISDKSDGITIKASDWQQLTIPAAGYPSGLNWTFIPSTPISLKEYAGKTNVRVAFKYLSSAVDGAAGSWEVKNILITEE